MHQIDPRPRHQRYEPLPRSVTRAWPRSRGASRPRAAAPRNPARGHPHRGDWRTLFRRRTGIDLTRCPRCGRGTMIATPLPLRPFVGAELASFKRPDGLTVLAELPLTPMFKVDKRALRERR